MIGQKIGKYRLTSYLGEGGMASVYEGVHDTIGSKAAVKILNPSLSSNSQIRERFKNEAKFMFSLKHPNIATIYDFEESDTIGSHLRRDILTENENIYSDKSYHFYQKLQKY